MNNIRISFENGYTRYLPLNGKPLNSFVSSPSRDSSYFEIGEHIKIIPDSPEARLRLFSRSIRELERLADLEEVLTHKDLRQERKDFMRDFDYGDAEDLRKIIAEDKTATSPTGFWKSPYRARFMVQAALATIPGFERARKRYLQTSNQKPLLELKELYEENVLEYIPSGSLQGNRQMAFFTEVGGCASLFKASSTPFKETGTITMLREIGLGALVNRHKKALFHPTDLEGNYWTVEKNAKAELDYAFARFKGFSEARKTYENLYTRSKEVKLKKSEEKQMEEALGKMVCIIRRIGKNYKSDSENKRDGGLNAFFADRGLWSLNNKSITYLPEKRSLTEILNHFYPGIVNREKPNHLALQPYELSFDGFWNDKKNAKFYILKNLDAIGGGDFGKERSVYEMYLAKIRARRIKNPDRFVEVVGKKGLDEMNCALSKMARLYRDEVIAYKSTNPKARCGGQQAYFYEVGDLEGLITHQRDFLKPGNGPEGVLKLAIPYFVDDNNPHALSKEEVRNRHLRNLVNQVA